MANAQADTYAADQWLPALVLTGGVISQDADASVRSGDLEGPHFIDSTSPIRPPASGDQLMVTADVGVGLELMTPRLGEASFSPRFFGHAGVGGAFGPDRDIAKEGVIRELEVDPDIVNPKDPNVLGQGSRTRVNVEPLLLRAGSGVALPFAAFGRDLRLRVSLEYMRQEIHVEGTVRRAVCNVPNALTPPRCGAISVDNGGMGIDAFREIDLRDSKTKGFNGLGPGVELEVDAGRVGSIVPALSIGAQAYRFLGDRDIKFYAENEYGEMARFSFKQKPWAFRAAVGVRFRWIPE